MQDPQQAALHQYQEDSDHQQQHHEHEATAILHKEMPHLGWTARLNLEDYLLVECQSSGSLAESRQAHTIQIQSRLRGVFRSL